MSTRSSARNLFPPLDNPELTIRRRSRSNPTLLNNSEMDAEGNGDLPATNFRLKNDMIQQVQNSCQFQGLPGDDANKHLDKNFHVTQSIKVNGVTNDALRLYLFSPSLTHHTTAWFDCPRNSINTFKQMTKMFLGKYFPPSMVTKVRNEITKFRQRGTFMKRRPKECFDLIKNMTAHHNDWDTSAQWSESSTSITSSIDMKIAALKAEMAEINKNLIRVLQVNQQVKAVTPNCETCGAPYSFSDCPATIGNTQNVYAARAYQGIKETILLRGTTREGTNSSRKLTKIPQPQVVTTNEFTNFMKANDAILKNMQTNMTSLRNSNLELKNMFGQFMKMNTASSSGSGTLPCNIITNPKEDLKGITTRSGTAYPGPTIPITSSSVVERETKATRDMMHPTNNGSTEDVQPSVVLTKSPILTSEPVISPIIEPIASPITALRPNLRPSIPYPSRLHDQKLRDKSNDQREKFFQIFKDLNFNISFTDALILMPKFGPSIKSLLTNKDNLCVLARTPLNEHCSVVLLKKLPKKLGDPGKFLIPCDFPGKAECLAVADLGASINLMSLSVWNKLSLPDLSPTCMTLDLADHSISHPVVVTEDVFIKVGTFHFPADFIVVDFDADPRVPLILERSFLKTERALIDVFEGELTLHVGKDAITFNLNQTLRYSANYNDMMAKRIDAIDMACKEYSQEVLGFSYMIASCNPTPYYDQIIYTTSLTLTPFRNSDFLLEEVDAFLDLEDDPTSPEVDQSYLDTKGDILLLESFLNDDPSLPNPNQGNYFPEVRKELKICETKFDKFLVDEPLEVELKDLPPHLEYAFLEGDDKLPVIIAKDLSVEEKTALITALKSHKRAIAWKLFDIKGAVLGQRQEKHFRPIHYASKTMTEAESNYTTTKKEMLAVVYAFEKFWSYLIMNKSIVYTNHSALKYLFAKKDSKARLLRWVLLFQEFTFKVINTKGAKNLAADHLSRLENPHQNVLDPKEINESFSLETLNIVLLMFAKVMLKYGVTHHLATPYHPQISGQVEVSNRGLKRILEMTVGENRASWSDKLDDALWAFQTAYKTPIGCTPYKLVYGKAKVQLNELHDQAYENSLIYKEKTKRLHDSKIKDRVFNIGDRVFLFNSQLKIFSGKLKSHWSGPFTISQVFSYGNVELSQPDGQNFKVNGHRLKHYFGEDVLKMVVPDI
nr:reverse transcriptase domain-containing protein [Tanacetum cinerariifolium]